MLTAPQRHAIIAYISFYGSMDHYAFDPTDISNANFGTVNPKRDEQ